MIVKKFNKGEMYWYINPYVKKEDYLKDGENQDFLDSRPVLIVSDYIDEYDSSVIVVPTTRSPHRYGIIINMKNAESEIETTKLMPMRLRTVPVQYLKSYIGQVDDQTLNRVYEAINFHFGNSKNKPAYVVKDQKIHKEISTSKQKKSKNSKTKKSIKSMNAQNIHIKHINQISNKKPEPNIVKEESKFDLKCPELEQKQKSMINHDITSIMNNSKSMRKYIYTLRGGVNKAVKGIYESIQSHKEKYKILTMSTEDISKKYKITVNHAIIIKDFVVTEFVIKQKILINQICSHSVSLKSFTNEQKTVFCTITNSELSRYIKKGDTVINNYKSQFIKELGL